MTAKVESAIQHVIAFSGYMEDKQAAGEETSLSLLLKATARVYKSHAMQAGKTDDEMIADFSDAMKYALI